MMYHLFSRLAQSRDNERSTPWNQFNKLKIFKDKNVDVLPVDEVS